MLPHIICETSDAAAIPIESRPMEEDERAIPVWFPSANTRENEYRWVSKLKLKFARFLNKNGAEAKKDNNNDSETKKINNAGIID